MKIHFMGIEGSGINGVSKLAKKMGFVVTGCDLDQKGHDENHVNEANLIVVSPAVLYQNEVHPEVVKAKKENKLITWQEFASRYLMKDRKVIAIAGTHGKSTTTAMVVKLLEDSGVDPLAIMGAKFLSNNESYRFGNGEYFVVEADEFNDNFSYYNPEIVILNNVEFDHPDFFKNETQVFETFKGFINKSSCKVLITNTTSIGVQKLLSLVDRNKIEIIDTNNIDKNFRLKIFGEHNILNAKNVFALGRYLHLEEEKIMSSIESFEGIKRRMELVYQGKGVKVFDDYAHHTTAIKTTLEGLRKEFPESRIWAIVEPHGFNRTNSLLASYNGIFDSVDRVIIGPIFKARDSEDFGVTPQKVAKFSGHSNVSGVGSFEEIKEIVNSNSQEGDVFIVMGAGRSNIWAQKLFEN